LTETLQSGASPLPHWISFSVGAGHSHLDMIPQPLLLIGLAVTTWI